MMPVILVVGFNVRPLARSAKKAGYRVLAVDFWGDLDLHQWADEYVAVLDQQPSQRPDRPIIPTADALVAGVETLLQEYGPVEYIITSGGFDDHPDIWAKLAQLGNLTGNSVHTLIQARDHTITQKFLSKYGAAAPISFESTNIKQFQSAINQLELPIVIKPKHGSGGFHTRVLRTENDIHQFIHRHRFSDAYPILIQELVKGTDASVSILSTGSTALTVSVNEQLIGLSELGKGRTKAYCGNIVPLEARSETTKQLARISEEISCQLGLKGSNGFDYVVDSEGTPYFMEINPRIQATIEAIELVSNINLVTLHIEACEGFLPQAVPNLQAYCTRMIVYALRAVEIPNLSNIPGVVDIPMPGSIAKRGDPVCTVNHIAATRDQALEGAWGIVRTIYNNLRPIRGKLKE